MSCPGSVAQSLVVVEHLMFECSIKRAGQGAQPPLGIERRGRSGRRPVRHARYSSVCRRRIGHNLQLRRVDRQYARGLDRPQPVGRRADPGKDLQAFVVLAISPHTLTNRPVVDSATAGYEVVVPRPHEGTSVVVDGRVVHKLAADDKVCVLRAEPCFKLVEVPGHGYYRTLREKLGWGGQFPLGERKSALAE